MKLIYLYSLIMGLGLATGCKQKKKSGGSTAPTNADVISQQQQLDDLQSTQVNSTARITLNGQDSSQTIALQSLNFDSLGGVPVVVENFTSSSMAIGILSGPSEVRLESSSGQYLLKGSIPSGASGTTTIVILARDLTKCGTTTGCNITPDSYGRFDQQQVQQNSEADLVAQFNVMLDTSTNNQSTNNGSTTNSGSGNTGGGFFSSISSGARRAWNYLKGLFY